MWYLGCRERPENYPGPYLLDSSFVRRSTKIVRVKEQDCIVSLGGVLKGSECADDFLPRSILIFYQGDVSLWNLTFAGQEVFDVVSGDATSKMRIIVILIDANQDGDYLGIGGLLIVSRR